MFKLTKFCNVIITSVAGLALGLTATSCSSDDEPRVETQGSNTMTLNIESEDMLVDNAYLDLQNQIAALSDTTEYYMQSRGFGSWFKKFKNTVVAKIVGASICDAVGGMFGFTYGGPWGAAAGAAICSILSIVGSGEIVTATESQQLQLIPLTYLVREEAYGLTYENLSLDTVAGFGPLNPCNTVGYAHNKLIINSDYSINTKNVDLYDLKCNMKETAATLSPLTIAEVDTILMSDILDPFINEVLMGSDKYDDLDEYFTKTIEVYPEYENQLNTMHTFYNTLSTQKDPRNKVFFQSAYNLVKESKIKKEDQNMINAGINIAYASVQLWKLDVK